uniref:Core-binding (CB) domain-containing protein n=1 Tax=Ignisphaera aggregans TaxID=334771 RepID=A0A7J2U2E8_9CREN
MSRAVRRVCMDLPDYLADFLDELAKLLGKEKSKLLTQILHSIYEAWRAGREASLRAEPAEVECEQVKIQRQLDSSNAVDEFRKVEGDKNIGLIKDFIQWLQSKGIQLEEINEDIINAFLRETRAGVSKNIYYVYRHMLKRFAHFIATRSLQCIESLCLVACLLS